MGRYIKHAPAFQPAQLPASETPIPDPTCLFSPLIMYNLYNQLKHRVCSSIVGGWLLQRAR